MQVLKVMAVLPVLTTSAAAPGCLALGPLLRTVLARSLYLLHLRVLLLLLLLHLLIRRAPSDLSAPWLPFLLLLLLLHDGLLLLAPQLGPGLKHVLVRSTSSPGSWTIKGS